MELMTHRKVVRSTKQCLHIQYFPRPSFGKDSMTTGKCFDFIDSENIKNIVPSMSRTRPHTNL